MTFKGVEINGSLADVVDNLGKVGFKYITTENRVAALEGEFAGFNALIIAAPNKKGDVFTIMATYYEGLHSWGKAVQLFDVLENNLTKKIWKAHFYKGHRHLDRWNYSNCKRRRRMDF